MLSAYYNEHDPFAAAWLRELMKAGEIPDGEVDERDIQAVEAADVAGFTQCHFFVCAPTRRLARRPTCLDG